MRYYLFLWLVPLYQLPLQSMSIQKQSNVQEVERKDTDDFNRIVFIPTTTGQCLRTFNGHNGWVISAVYNKDETHILSFSNDNTKLWDVSTGQCLRTTLTGHTDWVSSVVYNKDETHILSCSYDNTIKLWDVNTGLCLRTFTGHTNIVRSAVYNKDAHILSCSVDKTIKLWDVSTGLCLRTFTGHNGSVNSAVYNKDETHILSCSYDSTIKIWDARTNQCLRTFTGHYGWILSAVYNKDETHILSCSNDKTIKLWDVSSGQCLRTFTSHKDWVISAVYNKDETQILSCSNDNTIKLWDVSTGQCLRTFTGHKDRLRSAVYNKDETNILSRSADSTIKIWDIFTGQCLRTLYGHTGFVKSAVYNKDETHILSCSYDKTIKIWDNGYSYALNLASLSLLSYFLASMHSLVNQANDYNNDLITKLKEAVQFICKEESNPYQVFTMLYLYIVQHIPVALQREVLELLTTEALQKHVHIILAPIKPFFTFIRCTTIDETKRTIEHYLHQKHFSPCMIAFILDQLALHYKQNRLFSVPTKKESFDIVCLQQAAANTLASLKLLPHHNDHQHFNHAHAVASFDKLLKTNTSLTHLSGLKISTQSSLTRALEKNSAAAKPNSLPALENEAYVHKEELYAGLAIDSGLMHTLIPAVVLRTIEKKYNVQIHKIFDCIGGSGFGALIALGLTATRDNRTRFMDPQTIVDLFYKNAHTIFKSKNSKSGCYNPDNFKKVVRFYFNEIPLSDVLTHVIIPCSTINPTVPFIFDSLEAQKSLAYDFQLQDVVQAACADDFYFPTITFEDISYAQKATYRSSKPPFNPAGYVYEELLIKAKSNHEHIRLLSLAASFFTNPDHENELKIIETDSYLKGKLGNFSYRRLIPKVTTAQELHFGDRDDTRRELFDFYSQEAEKLVEDNNFIRLLVESKR